MFTIPDTMNFDVKRVERAMAEQALGSCDVSRIAREKGFTLHDRTVTRALERGTATSRTIHALQAVLGLTKLGVVRRRGRSAA